MTFAPFPSQIPNGLGAAHTISDTIVLPSTTLAIHLRVTTAGVLRIEDDSGATADIPFDTGTHRFELARMRRVHLTAATVVLAPATTVFPLVVKAQAAGD